jgi:hypothetical protein
LTLEKRIGQLDDAERDKVKKNIEIVVNVFDSNSKVLAVNSNKVIPDASGAGGLLNKKNPQGVDAAAIKMVNKNYKTKHCNKYHSDAGCGRGEACHFIHDIEYKGRTPPEPQKRSSRFPGAGYSNNMPSQEKPRSMGFGDSGQFGGMAAGYHNMHNSGMSGSYAPSMLSNSMGMRPNDNAGGYHGQYKAGANFTVTNLKPDKPATTTLHGGAHMNGGHNVLRMMPPPAPPAAPPRRFDS